MTLMISPPAAPLLGEVGKTVKLGVLVRLDADQAEIGQSIVNASRLAIQHANHEARDDGPVFGLSVVEANQKWGAQTTELSELMTGQEAPVILGAPEARTAHLLLQMVARTRGRALFLSLSSDQSLTESGVPWVFRLVPHDRAQAKALSRAIREIDDSRESAALILEESLQIAKMVAHLEREIPGLRRVICDSPAGPDSCLRAISERTVGILLGSPQAAGELVKAGGPARIFLGPLRLATPAFLAFSGGNVEGISLAGTRFEDGSTEISSRALNTFVRLYSAGHGKMPAPIAAYAYDAARIAIEAIRKCGPGVESIRECLLSHRFEGATGAISFDAKGDRVGRAGVTVIRHRRFYGR